MQNTYERRDSSWSRERRRYNNPSSLASTSLKHAYGWTPTVAANAGWRDASSSTSLRTPRDMFEASTSTIRFILLCGLWYLSSALSSNTGKAIMQIFRYPVTLTIVQFGFIAGYCLLLASPFVRLAKLRKPTPAILKSTVPMAAFQVGGHIFSSMAISRIPVSTVHTIKALSPLFTVAAYAMLFGVKYSPSTYLSLLPLTVGVMLACTFDMSASNPLGLVCAFGSAIIFVSSNIFFKKIMPTTSNATSAGSATATTTASTHRLDKINLLFYSSGLAFVMMVPIWLYYDFVPLINHASSGSIVAANRHVHAIHPDDDEANVVRHSVAFYFFANGTVHFLQNVIAFAILATTSPVTYSIASLIKRIAVICIAIVWFAQSIHPIQGFGICLTFVGLWMYNRAKGDVERGEKMARKVEAMREMVLPSTKEELELLNGPTSMEEKQEYATRATVTAVQVHPPPHVQQYPPIHQHQQQQQPRKPSHGRTFSRENPPNLPALNTTLAASYHVPKFIPVFSPPTDSAHPPNSGVMVDPYPSPPKSLDSPPPELNELVVSSGNSQGVEVLSATSQARNRRGTMQNHRTNTDDGRRMEAIPVH
ncbi:TPT-domain-containing protein [Serendipita vermifera]|nr:TPT-domain-containing protein [Serendipita vermifera]